MKLLHIALGIGGAAILIVGVMSLKSKLDYDREVGEITKLLGEFKAMGVPTNSSEYFKKIPDSENAWVEIGPVLLDEKEFGYFRSGLAGELIAIANPEDLPTLKRYLAVHQRKREIIAAALAEKPQFQVDRDYDLGVNLLYPELEVLRLVIREFCLEALAAAFEGNEQIVLRDLKIAVRLTNYFIETGELLTISVSFASRIQIMNTAMRIIEKRPNLYEPIREFLEADGCFKKSPPRRVLEFQFLNEIASARYYDLQVWDKTKAPFPLSLVVVDSMPTGSQVYELGKVQHGDYVPQSKKMRTYLRKRLERWKPIFVNLMNKPMEYEPSANEFFLAPPSPEGLPEPLRAFFELGSVDLDGQSLIDHLTKYKQYDEAYRVIWRAMDIKKRTGHYPMSLNEIEIPMTAFDRMGGITYTSSEKGIALRSVEKTSDGIPRFRVSFPRSLVQSKARNELARHLVSDFRLGKIDMNGEDIKARAQ